MQDLRAVAEDSVSIRVSWRSPAQPNGPITQYRLQVLVDDVLLQDITLAGKSVRGCVHSGFIQKMFDFTEMFIKYKRNPS